MTDEVESNPYRSYIGTKLVEARPKTKDNLFGYEVKYEDGYVSWSPVDAFEAAYTRVDQFLPCLSFSHALHLMKLGRTLSRQFWNTVKIEIQVSGMDDPRFYQRVNGVITDNWMPNRDDVFANDWYVVA